MVFTKIEGAVAILKSRAVYYQRNVYHRQGLLYVGYGSGFLRIHQIYGRSWFNTGKPDVVVEELDTAGVKWTMDKTGKLRVES